MRTRTQNPFSSFLIILWRAGDNFNLMRLLLGWSLIVIFLMWSQLVTAQQTYIVTKVNDVVTGGCQVGDCSLRSAILAANADGQASTIKFEFTTGSAPFIILVRGTPLPPIIDDDTVIDGLLDNGYGLGDVIIDGSLLTFLANGLQIMGNSTEIYGLQIQNFTSNGILAGDTGRLISVNIGGGAMGNIIINNGGAGIFSPIHLNLVMDGNYIGTDQSFSTGLGNGGDGIEFNSSAVTGFPIFRLTNSFIGNNGTGGVSINGRSSYSIVNNVIGTNPAADADLNNASFGIAIANVSAGGGTIDNNTIGYNSRGITVNADIPTTITENRIFCNFGAGILRTGNALQVDITDADPMLVSGTSNVDGGTVEVFLEDRTGCAATTPCQGKRLLGTTTVSGNSWSLDVSGLVSLGDVVTATVTDGSAIPNTSPFSGCLPVGCPAISANIDETPSCIGANSGSLSANPAGGVSPYTFTWSNGATSATISDLPPGIYTVTILDANNCRAIETGQVAEIPGPIANAGPDQLICEGENTTLTGTATGGVGPYTFNWDPGGAGASIIVSPASTTIYNLTVTDGQGCTGGDQVAVRVETGPEQPDAGPDQTLCAGETANLSGTIGGGTTDPGIWTASVGGGTFSPDATTLDATYTPPAGASSVTLTLSTTNGTPTCPDLQDEMTITYSAGPTADAGPDQEICSGETTTLSGSATGGVGPYTFSWAAGVAGATIEVSPSVTTVYELTVTDSQGCTDTDDVTVSVSTGPEQPDAGPDQTLCAGEAASLSGTIGGGTTDPGIWTASVGGGTFSPDATTLDAIYTPPAGASSVTLTLSTTNGTPGCPDLQDDMTITYTAGPIVDAGPDQSLCAGAPATLEGTIGGAGASGGWSASVAGGTFSPDNLDPNAVYTPPVGIANVVLTLTAVDASGLGTCPDVQDEITITYSSGDATADAGPDQVICADAAVSLSGSIGGSASSALWSTDGDGSFDDPAALITVYTPGPNDISSQGVILTLTTDGDALCPPAADVVNIRILEGFDYTITGTDPSTCGDPDGRFVISGLDPGAAYDVSYIFAGTVIQISEDASAAGEISVDNLGDGTYSEITVTDGSGCSGSPGAVVLNSPGGPQLSINSDPICVGSIGSVNGIASNGTPPYTFQWTDLGTGTAGNYLLDNTDADMLTVDATAAQPGTIDLILQVTDNGGCSTSQNISASIAALQEVSVIQVDSASSASAADGQMQFSISGGFGAYTYSWTGPDNGNASLDVAGTATITGLPGGEYSLLVEDIRGCMVSLDFRVGITPDMGGCTTHAGSLQAAPAGGIQACSSSSLQVVHNGDEVLDADDILVFVLRAIDGSIIKVNSEATFDFDPDVMVLDVIYLVSAMAGNQGPAGGVDPSDPCLNETNGVEVVFRESLTGVLNFLQGEEELCQGEELILTTNNLGTASYFWITPGRDTLTTNEPMVILPNIQTSDAGNYYVRVRDGNCLDDQTGPFNLIVNGLPAGNPICAGDDQVVCDNTVNLQACDPGPGVGSWTSLSEATLSNPNSPNTTATGLIGGENFFVWTVSIPACGSVGSDTVRVVYESSLFAQPDNFTLERANTEIFMDVLKNDNIATGAGIELTALTQPEFGVLETLSNGFRYYEYEQRRGTVEFIYQVCYLGGTCAGTCDTARVGIDVLNLPYLPEGITPDGDGVNDELTLLGYTPGNSELRLQLTIANQWGEIIYQSNDYTNVEPWKGNYKGQTVPQGAYYCHMETIVPEGSFVQTQTIYVVR